MYLAGIRLNDDVTGTADLSTVPLWMLDRVEVFRGNAPEAADRLGIGGAIFFEPRLPHHSRLGGGYALGSFGELSTWLGGAVAAPGAASMVALSRSYAKNDYTYVNDNGTRSTTADDRAVRRPNADATSYDSWAIGRTTAGAGWRRDHHAGQRLRPRTGRYRCRIDPRRGGARAHPPAPGRHHGSRAVPRAAPRRASGRLSHRAHELRHQRGQHAQRSAA